MAYTKQRLEEALTIFRDAKNNDRCRRATAVKQSSKYGLRRAVPNSPRRQISACRASDASDEDDEEYEPNTTRKKRRAGDATRVQRQKRKADDGAENEDRKRAKGMPRDAATRDSKEAYITVVLTSEKGKALLQDLGQEHGTGVTKKGKPGKSSRLADGSLDPMQRDLESRRKAQTYLDTLDLECAMIDNKGCRALRNRKVPDTRSKPRPDPCGPCHELQVRCRDSIKGVCQRCRHESIDCVPYRKGRNHHRRKQAPALPTPPSSGSSLESDKQVIVLDDTTNQEGSTTGNAIMVEHETPKSTGNEHSEIIELDSDSQSSSTGRIMKIVTSWAHPIDFKYYLQGPNDPPCTFCSNCLFGIFGLGPKEVEVLLLPGENCYQELGNGHRASGNEPTRMCVQCSLKRLRITDCKKHTFEPIPGLDHKSYPFQDYYDRMTAMMEGRTPPIRKFKYTICSICACPAFLQCCTKQERPLYGEQLHLGGGVEKGCGLVVCPRCIIPIEDRGVIQERYMRKHAIASNGKQGVPIYRADAEFLYPGSLLKKAYHL